MNPRHDDPTVWGESRKILSEQGRLDHAVATLKSMHAYTPENLEALMFAILGGARAEDIRKLSASSTLYVGDREA